MMNAPERFGNHPGANVKQDEYPGWGCGSRLQVVLLDELSDLFSIQLQGVEEVL